MTTIDRALRDLDGAERQVDAVRKYSEDEPRDAHGRWGGGGSASDAQVRPDAMVKGKQYAITLNSDGAPKPPDWTGTVRVVRNEEVIGTRMVTVVPTGSARDNQLTIMVREDGTTRLSSRYEGKDYGTVTGITTASKKVWWPDATKYNESQERDEHGRWAGSGTDPAIGRVHDAVMRKLPDDFHHNAVLCQPVVGTTARAVTPRGSKDVIGYVVQTRESRYSVGGSGRDHSAYSAYDHNGMPIPGQHGWGMASTARDAVMARWNAGQPRVYGEEGWKRP